jgi:hypothetical protein
VVWRRNILLLSQIAGGHFKGVGLHHTGFSDTTRIGTLISWKTGDESRCFFGKCEGRATRQVKEPSNHQGIGFWGEQMPEGKYGYGGCVVVMPPMNWTWDHTINRGAPGKLTISRDLDKERGIKRSQWTQAVILVNREKGAIRMAVNGIEVLAYVDNNPNRLKKGPIGLQAHAGNKDVRYKDIFIEIEPKEDRLITLQK